MVTHTRDHFFKSHLDNGKQFRIRERERRAHLSLGGHGFAVHRRALLITCVHRTGHACIDLHLRGASGDMFDQLHGLEESIGTVSKMTLNLPDGFQTFDETLYLLVKRLR
jgi:hypothetical protein